MKKYSVWGLVSASVDLGTYEAESKEAAEKMAEENNEVDWNPQVCWQCSNAIELGDVYDVTVDEVVA